MNNGKVRIYDLSRELNLENKDILGICDQLNIAVKSHSSTITESEAERIRTSAEKLAAQPVSPPKRVGNVERGERKVGGANPPSHGQNSPVHKPQILQIKHHTGADSGSKPQGGRGATPPQHPVRTNAAAPIKPNTLPRPVRPGEQDTSPPPVASQAPSLDNTAVVEVQIPESGVQVTSVYTEPPMRPAAAEAKAGQVTVKPVLKRAKIEQPTSAVSEASASPKPMVAKKRAPAADSDTGKRTAAATKPVPELQRPQRKTASSTVGSPALRDGPKPTIVKRTPGTAPSREERPGASRDTSRRSTTTMEDDDTTSVPDLDLELRKPNPPRLVKVKKDWVDSDDEDSEISAKAGKAGSKVKRKAVVLDEDDDDFASDLEDLPETVVVSLSVARPPKPKGRAGMPLTAVQSAATKKKAAPKSSGEAAAARDSSRRRDQKTVVVERPEQVIMTGSMTVRELASLLVVPETEIIKKLFFKGMAVNITQTLDVPTASMVAEEFGVLVETQEEKSEAIKVTEMLDIEDLEKLQRRPPVVTIMGHVDHGKTTLLDAIRTTKVAQGEAGGITQHIGAYHVDVEHAGKKEQIVFLDTPGHEAFTAMRARGARVTDIAVLVVAADDGVRPQTIEAISHAKAAGVPMVIAINKIDKPDAQPDRVKQELTEYGLVSEEWGGDTIMVPVSAIQKQNLDTLLEMILLVAEVGELRANPDRVAKGTVIEAHLDKAKGPVATLLVQNGTLRVGDTLIAGSVLGKVRAMVDDQGKRVEVAGPSWPVEVLGLSDVPAAGDEFDVFANDKEARAIASDRADEQRQSRLQQMMASRRVTLNSLSAKAQEGELKELNLILKADVQGSVEAILGSLKQLPQNEVQVRVLFAAPGEVTETDVDLASASGAVILGFNTTLASGARQAADQAGVDVREYNIIYKLLDDVQGAMEGLLEPEMVEEPLGQVEVRAVFPVGRGAVAGCYVLSGKAIRNCRIRIRRNNKVIHEGLMDSLKRMKDDAKEVNAGFECGVGLDKFNDWQEGDIIETYQMVSKRRTLSPN